MNTAAAAIIGGILMPILLDGPPAMQVCFDPGTGSPVYPIQVTFDGEQCFRLPPSLPSTVSNIYVLFLSGINSSGTLTLTKPY